VEPAPPASTVTPAEPTWTVGDAVAAVRAAYDDLASLAEDVEDEWSYVTDLAAAWTARLEDVVIARGSELAAGGIAAAVAALTAELAAIDDPHRAIDWLSTAPQVTLIALGERP
jgi:hypothetical protein